MLEIREERSGDIDAIRVVNQRAFGQDQEADIVDALRANGAVILSLVATVDDVVAGHILFSPIQAGSLAGAALAPMAVLPEYQRQGLGGRLVTAGISRLAADGIPLIIVLGHAAFYPRFGFKPASAYGITCPWPVADEVFMALLLDEARIGEAAGLARYRPEFSEE
jgi:putative acetyltransferase